MKFLDVFSPIVKGSSKLTEEAIYRSIQLGNKLIPLWGGNQDHTTQDRFVDEKAKTKDNKQIKTFEGEGVIISLDGSAGYMTYKRSGEIFALNHHAGFFKVKKGSEHLIDAKFFSVFFKGQMIEASVSDGSKTLSSEMIYSMEFDIPPKSVQIEIMAEYEKVEAIKLQIQKLNNKIDVLLSKHLSFTAI